MPHIHISDKIYERLEEGAERDGLDTVDAYAEKVLSQVMDRQSEDLMLNENEEETYSEASEQQIKGRLRDLGYIE